MKLSDFLKQQGDTPQGKSVYQAFIDNFDKDYDAESFRKDEKGSIAYAFQWDICPEDLEFWDIVYNKWQEVTDPENDMLWLLDGKEPPQEVADKDSGCDQVDSKRKQIGGDHYAGHNNGGNTDYYKLPEGATELQDIIEHKKMHWNIANMFKALYRMGQQDHSSIERDLNKIEYFLKRHKELLRKDML